jgi:hypothetical protein
VEPVRQFSQSADRLGAVQLVGGEQALQFVESLLDVAQRSRLQLPRLKKMLVERGQRLLGGLSPAAVN